MRNSQPRFQIKVCVATLGKYLENIILNPTDEKYRKIRKSNKAYQVDTCLKVAQARGANLGSFWFSFIFSLNCSALDN